jgi:hypothetical protein
MVRRLLQHIEWPATTILFGFVALAAAMRKDVDFWFVALVALIGLALALLAAHNSYVQKSTALLDKYEETFFRKMRAERKSAAQFLLGQSSNSDELEDVLDFFEAPMAKKLERGCIDAEELYEIFYHVIRLYHQASKKFVDEYRGEEPAAYTSLDRLYAELSKFEKRELETQFKRPYTEEELTLKAEKLKEYLQQEARLSLA